MMACWLGRVQASLPLLSLRYAIARGYTQIIIWQQPLIINAKATQKLISAKGYPLPLAEKRLGTTHVVPNHWYSYKWNYSAFASSAAGAEQEHEKRYLRLLERMENEHTFHRPEPVVWQCRKCGYTYIGHKAPDRCPSCLHPKGYFEVKAENY